MENSVLTENYEPVRWTTANSCAAGNCVRIAATGDGQTLIGDTKYPSGPVLRYTKDEWVAFLAGAKNGDFDEVLTSNA